MALSKQTAQKPVFAYNPFNGAQIHLFVNGFRSVHILQPLHVFKSDPDLTDFRGYDENGEPKYGRLKQAYACHGRISVSCDSTCAVRVKVDGKYTEAYSIVYPGKRRKQRFAKY